MCSEADVIRHLQLLLKSSDLASTSEESLTSTLSTHFMKSMTPFDQLIKVRACCQVQHGSTCIFNAGELKALDKATATADDGMLSE